METNIRRSVNPEVHTAIFTFAPKNKKKQSNEHSTSCT